ncbi:MAG: DUF881 domain-containing protein [Jatrophihabitans sp.]
MSDSDGSEPELSASPPPANPLPTGRRPPDTGPADRPAGRRLNRGATVLIGALLAILGFGLAVQLRSNSQSDSLAGAREDDLVRILDDQNSRIDRLQSQISDLQSAKQRLSDSGSNNAAARQDAQRQADALAVLTGTAPAHGPGVTVTITDPARALRAEDLLDVVEELRGAGAEVIQFGPVRVAAASAFTDTPAGVELDRTAIGSPYTVLAIGDPKTLDTALNITGGVVNSVHAAGGQVSIIEQDRLSITVTRTVTAPKYASPTGK